MAKKPKLLESEIVKEIRNRTLYPADIISKVLHTYVDIVKQTIPYGIDCIMPELGSFTCLEVRPRKDVTVYNFRTNEHIEHVNLAGHKRMGFSVNPSWKEQLKAQTLFNPWEEKEGEGNG